MNKDFLRKIIAEEFQNVMQEDNDGIASESTDGITESELEEGVGKWIATAVAGIAIALAPSTSKAAETQVSKDSYTFQAKDAYGKPRLVKVDKSKGGGDEAAAYEYAKSHMYELDKEGVGTTLEPADSSYYKVEVTKKDGTVELRGFDNTETKFTVDVVKGGAQQHWPGSKVKVETVSKAEADKLEKDHKDKLGKTRESHRAASKFEIRGGLEGGTPEAFIVIDLSKLDKAESDRIKSGDLETINKVAKDEVDSYKSPKTGIRFEFVPKQAVSYEIKGNTIEMKVKVKSLGSSMKEYKKINKQVLREMIEECMHDAMQDGMESLPAKSPQQPHAMATPIDPDGYEGEMAKGNLFNAAKAATSLHNLFGDQENLEPWVEEKIAIAANMLKTVADYIEYQKMKGGR